MQHRRVAVATIAGEALMAADVPAQQFSAPEFGVVPEMFDWSLGRLGFVIGSVLSILILAIAIGVSIHLMHWIGALWHRHGSPSAEPWIEGHK
jgi:hypothetical protein